jgi:dolichyl-phosphate beta-glucosyltransferase
MYNEEDRVSETFASFVEFIRRQARGSWLVFVDDGSEDATVEVVYRALEAHRADDCVTVLCRSHEGKGAAVRAGLSETVTDIAAFCDVDLATPLEQLELLVAEAIRQPSLAIGSRSTAAAQVLRHERRRRELLGKAFNRVVRLALCRGIADTQCGAKAAQATVWKAILPYSVEDGFAWDVEVIALARRFGIPVTELGVRWSHDERTRVRLGRDGVAMVLALPRIWYHVHKGPSAPFALSQTYPGLP